MRALRGCRFNARPDRAPVPSWTGGAISACLSGAFAVAPILWPGHAREAYMGDCVEVTLICAAYPCAAEQEHTEPREEPVTAASECDAAGEAEPDEPLPAIPLDLAAFEIEQVGTPEFAFKPEEPRAVETPPCDRADETAAVRPVECVMNDVGAQSGWANAESNYWQTVRTAVTKNLRYPRSARWRGVEGDVSVSITLDGAGRLVDVSDVASSDTVFSKAVLEAVRRAAPFPSPPPFEWNALTAVFPVAFRLKDSVSAERSM